LLDLPRCARQVAAEVRCIASRPGRIDQRAEALLEPFRRVVPFRAAWISLLDPELGEQAPLISQGYPDGFRQYLSGPGGVAEIDLLGLSRPGTVTRMSDLSIPLEEVWIWAEFLAPAGFRDGLAVALFAPDGRYLGILGLTSDIAGHPTAAARNLFTLLAPAIAQAIDPMQTLASAARIVHGAQAAIALTRAGRTLPLPGLPAHALLDGDSPVLTVASAHLAAHHDLVSFLCPYATGDAHQLQRITVLGGHPAGHLRGVVVVSPRGHTHGLDRRELEILGWLVDDWPDERIAGGLGLTPLTIAEHAEQICTKLAAPTRAAATFRAIRQGLYVPSALTRHNRIHR
jgi:DNA-binding CsgD family transcriptional regulator